ncbi:MAG: DUF3267 domain-containing protein [Thermonemataceae bacterium]|nr:DUF3267 domain-containing protein [Thermonemataceae bacterium]
MQKIAIIDFENNKLLLWQSYMYRVIGFLVFGLLFATILAKQKSIPLITSSFLDISLPIFQPFASIILISLDVILVLYLHELIHALVFYLSNRQKFTIGMRNGVIFAAAPEHLIAKRVMYINAFAPFVVISLLATIGLTFIKTDYIAWFYIPLVINAGASAGDFMIFIWMLQHKKTTLYKDKGGIIEAYTLNT